ncbi:DUF4912 domain-containing protein [Marinitoga sp. 38H-ov]|uniref:DUF4912 domain-containing protein n=1 Tax=Marinitoga sp. 38H-ov TaxID=1755814 RepID=UPI0013ED5F7B|nr:DUF4912 domain-containing protein [Marinitoga sp. 38H-ov]KAF2955788.1 hypothetical protein AS160_09095 [Marinitoga sp. 38H-ov]
MIIDKKLSNLLDSEEPSIQELRNIAKNMGIKLKRSMRKKDIIKVIKSKLIQLKEEGLITETSNSYSKISIENINLVEDKPLNKNILIITSVNSHWIYAQWFFSKELYKKINKLPENIKIVMRFYEIKENTFDDINRIYESNNDLRNYKSYYFFVPESNVEYIAEIGYLDFEKNFISLIKSNKIKMPSEKIQLSENLVIFNLKTNKKKKIRKKIDINIVEKIPSLATGNMALHQLGDKPPISGGGSFVWNLYSRGTKK